jgi:hypothetical protein
VRVVSNSHPQLGIEGDLGRGRGFHDLMSGVGAHEIIVETHGMIAVCMSRNRKRFWRLSAPT